MENSGKKYKYRNTIALLLCSAFVLFLLKLLFLPFFSTVEKEFPQYSKDSIIGENYRVDLAYIEPIETINHHINKDNSGRHVYYYYGFDESYNFSLIAINDKDRLILEEQLSDKNNTNKTYYGTLVDSTAVASYDISTDEVQSDYSDLFDNSNDYSNDFSVNTPQDSFTVNDVIREYNFLLLDPDSSGTELVKTGLGVGAFALLIAVACVIVAFVLIRKSGYKLSEKSDNYYVID